jgi:hypothetical protein
MHRQPKACEKQNGDNVITFHWRQPVLRLQSRSSRMSTAPPSHYWGSALTLETAVILIFTACWIGKNPSRPVLGLSLPPTTYRSLALTTRLHLVQKLKKRVEVHIYSSSESSWPVLGEILFVKNHCIAHRGDWSVSYCHDKRRLFL